MDKWSQLNDLTAGRDKLARLIQYTSRAVWDSLEAADCKPSLSERFKTLEYILSSFRKLLRLGRCLDVFYASLGTIHCPDLIVRVTLTMSKISQSIFLLADHLMWMSRTGLFSRIDVKKWSKLANKYWLFSIAMNLSRDIYEIVRLLDLNNSRLRGGGSCYQPIYSRIKSRRELKLLALQSYDFIQYHKEVVVDTVKNVCDLFIPLTSLGYTNLTPRSVGMLGMISSVAALFALCDPSAKISPA